MLKLLSLHIRRSPAKDAGGRIVASERSGPADVRQDQTAVKT
ncbi:MAG: hypothetical protein V4712_10455 [Pseudomonadota bacterium]